MKSNLVGTGYRSLVCTALERSLTTAQTVIIAPQSIHQSWASLIEEFRLTERITLVNPLFKTLPAHRLIIVDELHDQQNRSVAFKLRNDKEVMWLIDMDITQLDAWSKT